MRAGLFLSWSRGAPSPSAARWGRIRAELRDGRACVEIRPHARFSHRAGYFVAFASSLLIGAVGTMAASGVPRWGASELGFLVFWEVVMAACMCAALWGLVGRETFDLADGVLTHTLSILCVHRARSFSLDRVTNVGVAERRQHGSEAVLGRALGFDYDRKAVHSNWWLETNEVGYLLAGPLRDLAEGRIAVEAPPRLES